MNTAEPLAASSPFDCGRVRSDGAGAPVAMYPAQALRVTNRGSPETGFARLRASGVVDGQVIQMARAHRSWRHSSLIAEHSRTVGVHL